MDKKEVALIGYSGHTYVACDIFLSQGYRLLGYLEENKKDRDPYHLPYLGYEKEESSIAYLKDKKWFVGIGNNGIRGAITQRLKTILATNPISAIHQNASISSTAELSHGVMVGDGTVINACAIIDEGVICNTQSVIEHECQIGAFAHIAPGAVLCGNVKVGKNTFIGARAVVKQGVTIGDHVIIGAGAVVLKDIPDHSKVVGNPQKFL